MRALLIFSMLSGVALADATVAGPADGEFVLREPRTAALLGDDYDPRRVSERTEGWMVGVHHGSFEPHDWLLDVGRLTFDCRMESNPISAPRWRDGVLHITASNENLYECTDEKRRGREVTIARRADGTYDVSFCGRRVRMVRSEDWYARRERWSRDTAKKIMGDAARTLACRTVALDCDLNRLAAACPLPLDRTLVFAAGRRPFILPPRSGYFGGSYSQLEWIAEGDNDGPVWCVTTTEPTTASESP